MLYSARWKILKCFIKVNGDETFIKDVLGNWIVPNLHLNSMWSLSNFCIASLDRLVTYNIFGIREIWVFFFSTIVWLLWWKFWWRLCGFKGWSIMRNNYVVCCRLWEMFMYAKFACMNVWFDRWRFVTLGILTGGVSACSMKVEVVLNWRQIEWLLLLLWFYYLIVDWCVTRWCFWKILEMCTWANEMLVGTSKSLEPHEQSI